MDVHEEKEIIAQYLEHDGVLLRDNGIPPQQSEQGSFKNRYWKFVGGFLVIVVLCIIATPFISDYMKKEKAEQYSEATDQLYKRDLAVREQLRNDTDGGTTPEETLSMFISALKDGNIEKAKLYYSPYPEKRSAMFKARLDQLNQEGKINELIDLLGKVTLEEGEQGEGYSSYSYINNDGKLAIVIRFNKAIQYSTIWKIESLAY